MRGRPGGTTFGTTFGVALGMAFGVALGAASGGPAVAAAQTAPGPDACDGERGRALGGFEVRMRSAPTLASAGPEVAAASAARGAPRGYLGLRLSEVSATGWTPEGRVVRYCGYPVVVSVEPASPAERAGVDAGDTLVAYGGRDLVRAGPVPLDQLLVPGRVLRVHLRRGGRTLVRQVTVGRAPSPQVVAFGESPRAAFGSADGPGAVQPFRVEVAWPPAGAEGTADPGDAALEATAQALRRQTVQLQSHVLLRGQAPAATPTRVLVGQTRSVQAPQRPPAQAQGRAYADARVFADAWATNGAGAPEWLDVLRALPTLPATAWAAGAPAALAGAQLVALDDDLREVLARTSPAAGGAAGGQDEGPVRGVFVLKVLPGTPAAEAGLRAGDVVTTAGGRMVATPAALQRVLAARTLTRGESPTERGGAERRTVPLRVWRAGVARQAVLRW